MYSEYLQNCRKSYIFAPRTVKQNYMKLHHNKESITYNSVVTMKIKNALCYLLFASMLVLMGCSSSDEDVVGTNENSTAPNERIVGSWKLIKVNDEDVSDKDIYMTINADGTWTNNSLPPVSEQAPSSGVEQRLSFATDWVYDEDKDIISGCLSLFASSFSFPYRFELKRTELKMSYEPQDVVYVMPPTIEIHYFKRVQ